MHPAPSKPKPHERTRKIFWDDVMAGALIERLVHHCHMVKIRGNSYRMREGRAFLRGARSSAPSRATAPHDLAPLLATQRSAAGQL